MNQVRIVKGKMGPDILVEDKYIPNVHRIELDFDHMVMSVFADPATGTAAKEFDLANDSVNVSIAIAKREYTVTISQ